MPGQLTATKTSHEKWIHSFSVSILIIPTRLLCYWNATELFWCWISKEKESFVTHCLFTSFTKRETRHFQVVVLQWLQRNVQQRVMHVQSCQSSYCFFWFLARRRCILNFLLFTSCDRSETEFSFLSANWVAPADSIRNDFRLIGSSFVWLGKLGERTGQLWRDNSRRVRTQEKDSGEIVRRLGTIIQSIFCAQSAASIRLTVWKWSCESRYPGALRPCLKTFVAPFLPAQLTAPGSPRMFGGILREWIPRKLHFTLFFFIFSPEKLARTVIFIEGG